MGIYKKNIFSLLIQHDGPNSCDFGPPNANLTKGDNLNKKAEIIMNDDFFWSSYLMGVSFGDIHPENGYTFGDGYVYTIF